jgi:hypothetical protein
MANLTEDLLLDIDIPDDSILAHKKITVRPITQAKLKHIRAAQRVFNAGRDADMDDMIVALAGFLVGWSEEEVGELTLAEMTPIMDAINAQQQGAIPNAKSSSLPPRSAQARRRLARTG